MKSLSTLLLSLCLFSASAQTITEISKFVASDRAADDLFGVSVAIDGSYAIIGAYTEDEDTSGGNTLGNAGAAYIFEKDGSGNWAEVQKLVASDRNTNDNIGYDVAISGNYALVSAHNEDEDTSGMNTLSSAGSVYVFERDGNGDWIEVQKLVASDRAASDFFGISVSISGGRAIIGAANEDEDTLGLNTLAEAGAAYIFERDGFGVWHEKQKLVASDRDFMDQFGTAVAINFNYAVVGAIGEDHDSSGSNFISNTGSAYVFERDGGGIWNQVDKLVALDRGTADAEFGTSLEISGSFLIVGAPKEAENELGLDTKNTAGAAYVFMRGSADWPQQQKIVASDRAVADLFGAKVDMDGSFAVVAAPSEDEDALGGNTLGNSGSAYLFIYESNLFTEDAKLVASDRGALDNFAGAVGVDQDKVLIGAYWEDEDTSGSNTMMSAGSAYIYDYCFPTDEEIDISACDSYTSPDGQETWTMTGSYYDTIPNAEGCDSAIKINLIISATGTKGNYEGGTLVSVYTNRGTFHLEMYDELTPITSGNFVDLVLDEYYDGVIFHRVINHFMIQGGDPTGTGSGGPGYSIPDEFDSTLSNIQTTISMANSGPNTGGSQFFINLVDNTYLDFDKAPLSSKHPVFGIVDSNFCIVQEIGSSLTDGSDRPVNTVVMDSVRVLYLGALGDTTGFNELSLEEQFQLRVYPNPVTQHSVISIRSNQAQRIHVSMYDQMGRLVFEQDKQIRKGLNVITSRELAAAKLAPGLYYLRISGKSETLVRELVVIK